MNTRKNSTSKYTVDEVLRTLNKKKDCLIKNGTIYILTGQRVPKSNDLGIKSLGKIDFLTKFCGYVKEFVSDFSHLPNY